METGYFWHLDLAINSNKNLTIHCIAYDLTNSLAKFGVDIYFPLRFIAVGSKYIFNVYLLFHGNHALCHASTKVGVCSMLGTRFVPSFNVIGQILFKLKPEDCFGKFKVNYHLCL